jgi:hypothetical protein
VDPAATPEEAERAKAARKAAIARITAELDRITATRTRAREHARRRTHRGHGERGRADQGEHKAQQKAG